jgi:hypothetical protein
MSVEAKDVIDASGLFRAPVFGSGRAAWDDRGNSIWEWQTRPGVFTRDVSEHELRALEATDLSLVEAPASVAAHHGGNVLHWRKSR